MITPIERPKDDGEYRVCWCFVEHPEREAAGDYTGRSFWSYDVMEAAEAEASRSRLSHPGYRFWVEDRATAAERKEALRAEREAERARIAATLAGIGTEHLITEIQRRSH